MEEINLKEYLSKYRNHEVDFFRFPGNYGDSLIWHGTKKLLSELHISARYVEPSSETYNKTLFIDGGGNFVDYYSDVAEFLVSKKDEYNEIVILPHTIFGERQANILNGIRGDVTVFCREPISAKFLDGSMLRGKVYLWHDCAFYNKFDQRPAGEGVLSAFRLDCESILRIPSDNNIDISRNGYATKPLAEFLSVLEQYAQVDTDRLHVAIGAALMGKKVNLFPNSYYKNEGVFNYSLKKFPNVNFCSSR